MSTLTAAADAAYRPGDCVIVPDGDYKRTAEIDAVNDDGTYRVGSWSHEAKSVVYRDVDADAVTTSAAFKPGDKLLVERFVYTNDDETDWTYRKRTATVVRYIPANHRERRGDMDGYEVAFADGETEQISTRSAKAAPVRKPRGEKREPRAKVVKPPAETLPRIVAFEGTTDHGEYGAATCPHCGADGRYITWFACADGTRRGAMAGCIKLFPISAMAAEHGRLIARRDERAKKGQQLASWDKAKLAAIDAFIAGGEGAPTEGAVLETIRHENARRSAWMDRRKR